ncbi:ELM1/GtrOC1 family putative glycosyltransferase [Microbulbifer agarilyticus]|uniref:ELM1/GtrOC1 family putative glycosyltransferase n=1 Tax=Microbulbifer agarilyticus TaxID=260552 RepID=UPI001CD79AF7|nr:ELM1/GtrOC1 family putative glycosyltransferase [Microbulbifer agarilyticus]MCA0899612.1 mitochondrial fission ELM1 family protein [Microbulbifer agarilyticus]
MITVWRFVDGNKAHEKQSAALLAGLRERMGAARVQSCDVDCSQLRFWLPGSLQMALDAAGAIALGQPDFLIGAGHRCHLPLLAARKRFGGRSVVLMRPSLPIQWFDFALIPEHDRPPALPNVLTTRGALTLPLPQEPTRAGTGLILLGGPSRHFAWDSVTLERDIGQLATNSLQWTLADSRRTPEFALQQLARPGFTLASWRECDDGWLEQQLASVEQVWVTRDSISMVFEALQSRAQVGVLALPSRNRENKVRAAVQRLIDEGLVSEQLADAKRSPGVQREPLNQYQRLAAALLRRCNLECA